MSNPNDQTPANPELASVLAAAGAVDAQADTAAGVAPPEGAASAAPSVDPAEVWASIPATIGGVLCMALPELKAVYTPEACRQWGASMVPVAVKHGWETKELPVEIPLMIASLGFLLPTLRAVQLRRAAAQADKPQGAVVLTDGAGDGVAGD